MGGYRLLGCRGCGSFVVECAFVLARISYDYEEVDYEKPGPERDRLLALNPLGQVPTLILPDGSVMTESAAIILMINDLAPQAGLVPDPHTAERNTFFRWLFLLMAAIYPTFTYGDDPVKWLPGAADPSILQASTDRHRENLWRQVEAAVSPNPWLLGSRFSALDLYIGAMTHWRPRQAWFETECPKLLGIARTVQRRPELTGLFEKGFP